MFDASDNANAAALRQFGQVPVRCMSALLEYFVGYCCPIQVRGMQCSLLFYCSHYCLLI